MYIEYHLLLFIIALMTQVINKYNKNLRKIIIFLETF